MKWLLLATTIYSAHVIEVKDGDTVKMAVSVWPGLVQIVDIRLNNIDTPETRNGKKNGVTIPPCEIALGKEATAFTSGFLTGHVTISNVRYGKYAKRMLADVQSEGKDLGSALIQSGLGIRYDGGKREVWGC